MNIAGMTEGTIESGHRSIRQWQQGGSNSIQMPDGQLCPALLSSPAIVLLLTLIERGVSSLLGSSTDLYDVNGKSAV